MRCPSCGLENHEDAAFCGECECWLRGELACGARGRQRLYGVHWRGRGPGT